MQVFSCEYYETFKNTYFEKQLPTVATEFWKYSTHKNSNFFTKIDNRVLIWYDHLFIFISRLPIILKLLIWKSQREELLATGNPIHILGYSIY